MSAGAFIATKAGILPQDLKRHPKKAPSSWWARFAGSGVLNGTDLGGPIQKLNSRFGKARADQLKLENARSHDAMRRWPGKSLRIEEAISLIDRLNGVPNWLRRLLGME